MSLTVTNLNVPQSIWSIDQYWDGWVVSECRTSPAYQMNCIDPPIPGVYPLFSLISSSFCAAMYFILLLSAFSVFACAGISPIFCDKTPFRVDMARVHDTKITTSRQNNLNLNHLHSQSRLDFHTQNAKSYKPLLCFQGS